MVTNLGMFLSIVALVVTIVVWLIIMGKLLDFVDNLPILLEILFAVIYAVFGIFFMSGASICTGELFRKPVDIIVFDERGNYVCEYNEIEEVNETRDGLSFEYNGRKHVIQNYSWEWSE